MKNTKVTMDAKDVSYILESLLFSSSVDVIANWSDEDYEKFIDIAERLGSQVGDDVKIKNIKLFKGKLESPKISKRIRVILKRFR